MSSDWSCKVNNKGKLCSVCVFTHPRCADYNKVTPQNLHRAKRARTLNGLDSATQTGNVLLLMEQTDTEPKWLCLIVSANCSCFTDGCCSVQSHTQSRRYARHFVSEMNLSSFQGQGSTGNTLLWPADALLCRLPWLHILWSQVKVRESSLAWWGCLSDRNISWHLRIIWKMVKVKGHCYEDFWGLRGHWLSELLPHSSIISSRLWCFCAAWRPVPSSVSCFFVVFFFFELLTLPRSELNKRPACSDPLWSLCSLPDSQKLVFQIQS